MNIRHDMRYFARVVIAVSIVCLSSVVWADDTLIKFFQEEFKPEDSKQLSKTNKAYRKDVQLVKEPAKSSTVQTVKEGEYSCPEYVPEYVCEIIKFFKPLPFTHEEEKRARTDPVVRKRVRVGLISNIEPFLPYIEKASTLLDVPEPLIISVINTESGGNPKAKNPRSSAKGLMQTIDSTFRLAKNRLREDYGVKISKPLDPKSSIFAGTWYLRYVYDWAVQKHLELMGGRARLENWEKALMNYYLGPGHERYLKGKLVVYPNGHIEKLSTANRYVSKIMTFAETVSG